MNNKYSELLQEYEKLQAEEQKKINFIIWLRAYFGSI